MRDLLKTLPPLPGSWQFWSLDTGGRSWYAPADDAAHDIIDQYTGTPDVSDGLLRYPSIMFKTPADELAPEPEPLF